jgi:RHS repeat-associated protein
MARFEVVLWFVCIFLVCSTSVCNAQVDPAAGVLPFSTHVGGQYDSIDPATGNIMLTIPVAGKTGKIPFSYSLIGNFHTFEPYTSAGIPQIAVSASLSGAASQATADLGFSTDTSLCYEGTANQAETYTDHDFFVADASGASHPFYNLQVQYGNCGISPTPVAFGASDGSGYTLVVSQGNPPNFPVYTIYDRSGNKVQGPADAPPHGTFSMTDPDGVQLSTGGTFVNNAWATTYTDTLGQTALSATVRSNSGGGGSWTPGPDTYTYTGADGNPKTVQVNYTRYPQKTTFGCPYATDIGTSVVYNLYFPTSVVLPDGETFGLSYEATPGYPGDITGRLTQITLPSGGTISYAYSGGHQGVACYVGESAILTRTVNDNNGHTSVWTYVKSPGSDQYGNFMATVTDPVGDVTTYHFYGELQTEKIVQDVNLGVLSTTVTCYNGHNTSQAACIAPQAYNNGLPIFQTDVYTSLGTSAPSLVETKLDYDGALTSYGNVIATKNYDVGATYPPSGVPVSETDATYANIAGVSCGSVSAYIFDHPCIVTTYNSSSAMVSQTKYTYNGAGHATQSSAWVTGSTYLNSSASYNSNGTPATSTDANGAITNYYYNGTGGCNNFLLTSTTLPGNLTSSQTWNCVGAVVTSSTDLNSNVTHFYYNDPFWRPTQVTYPDGGSTTTTYNTGTSLPWTISTSSAIDATHNLIAIAYFDGLGRTVQKNVTSDPSGTDYILTTYDLVSRVASVTNPYRSTSDPTYGSTSYTYDALSRPLQVTHPDGNTVVTNYSGRATKVQNEGNGASRVTHIYQSDGLGRLKSSCEVTSTTLLGITATPAACGQDIAATGFLTSYQYDALGDLLGVTQGGLNARSYTYDGLSRLTSETNPESGTTTYAYDTCSAGDLCTRTAPKPNQTGSATVATTYSYDALHRLTAKNYNDGSTPTAVYYYDQSVYSNYRGRLTSEGTYNGGWITAQGFWYDSMGRVISNNQYTPLNINSGAFSLSYQYDLLGDVTSIQNGVENVTYTGTYDTAARLTKFQSTYIDAYHPGTLLTVNQYNPLNEVQQETLGNGIVRNLTYDNRGRVKSQTDGSIYNFMLSYTPDSNVSTGSDSVTGNWTYAYDDFSRLSTSSKSGQAFSYKYDRFGNRWQQNVTAGTGPAPQYTFDANNHLTTSGFTYDAAGNVINDGSHSYTYDAEGRVTAVDGGSKDTYVYDAEGRVVRRSFDGYPPMDFVLGLNGKAITELANGGTWDRSELYAAGTHVATYADGITYFFHPDWLGSVRAETKYDGTLAGNMNNLSFGDGQVWTGRLPSWSNFAGGDVDEGSYVDLFMFRQYSTTQGRWMMPDPAGRAAADPANPQSWNLYAYVMNNPLSFTDPLGLYCYFGDGQGFGWGTGRDTSKECGKCDPISDASCAGTPSSPGQDPAGDANSYFGAAINESHQDDQAAYLRAVSKAFPGHCIGSFYIYCVALAGFPPANNFSWWGAFAKSFFGDFSFESARGAGESFMQCVSRVRAAGGSFTAAVDATSGVGAATYLSSASFGATTYTVWRVWGNTGWASSQVIARNLSLAEGAAISAAGKGLISPTTAGIVGKVAAPLAKVSAVPTAVALGLEGGVLGACR